MAILPLQTTFTENQAIGYAGMPANGELKNDETFQLEGVAVCPNGAAVFKGANDNGCDLTPVATEHLGFVLHQKGMAVTPERAADTFIPRDMLRVRRLGSLYVNSTTAANKDQPVFLVAVTGVVTNVSAGNIAATGWVFDQTIAAAGVVRVIRR